MLRQHLGAQPVCDSLTRKSIKNHHHKCGSGSTTVVDIILLYLMSIKYISLVAEVGLICYNALNVDLQSTFLVSDWCLRFLQTSGALQIMSNASISSAEVAYPDTDSERRSGRDDRDYSLTASTSLPERFSEITFSSNCMQELVAGMCFEIKGKVPKTSERFSVNLTLNNVHRDIALHFNPRLPQSYVVRNSK